MNKLIPIISICVAVINSIVSAIGLVTVSVATSVSQLALVAIPTAIIGAFLATVSCGVNAMFFKNKLCRIALFINIGAAVAAYTAIIIWLVAL